MASILSDEGNVVNQVEYVYNAWGRVALEKQEHDGTINQYTPFVDYTYADGASGGVAKYVRLSQVTYPNGRQVHHGYGTTQAIDNIMSRLATIGDGSNTHASYKYLGARRIVTEDYEQIDVKLDYSADNFASLDRFGRVVDQVWTDYGAEPDVPLDRYTYTYDRAGNRTARDNEKNAAFDEDYTYDDLDRLASWRLNGVLQKSWANLDGLGNDLDTGTYNAANEMTPNQGSSGYDDAGSMTTLRSGRTAVYDAWNRLVRVNDGQTILQRNEYDGTNRRIQVFSDFDGSTPDRIVDDYHVGQQTIESDVTVDGQRDGGYQTVWSPRYIDAPILRDTLNTAGTGIVAAERVFYLADAHYNVTGLVKYDSGTSDWEVVERYTYTPYGDVTYRNEDWSTAGSSANANTTLYTGRELDVFDQFTSVYYYRARYYDAVLERFIGRDPVGYRTGDNNLYRYVAESPLTRTDPTGLLMIRCQCSAAETGGAPETDWAIFSRFTIEIDWTSGSTQSACTKGCQARDAAFTGRCRLASDIFDVDNTLRVGNLCDRIRKSPNCSSECKQNCEKMVQQILDVAAGHSVCDFPDNCGAWVDHFPYSQLTSSTVQDVLD